MRVAIVALAAILLVWPGAGSADMPREPEGTAPARPPRSSVTIETLDEGVFRYLVDGEPQVFIGMGYNPIYRDLSDEERGANYDRDFRTLCKAGVNHILGWDADKGYEQDKFDEVTLDHAQKYGVGVVMPFYLPGDGDYTDEDFEQGLLDQAVVKVARFRDHPALRLWGIGNEVLENLPGPEMREAFGRFYLRLADLVHSLDPNHPVIYREAEDFFVPEISDALRSSDPERPWLLYGMNIYTGELDRLLQEWPENGLNRPLIVTEFGADPDWLYDRPTGYLAMWLTIRGYPDYVLGGAPYTWTIAGPEPTDEKWGLMDGQGHPVDDTFAFLRSTWLHENGGRRSCPQ